MENIVKLGYSKRPNKTCVRQGKVSGVKLPPVQKTAAAWYGHQLASHPEQWTIQLTQPEVEELAIQAEHYLQTNADIENLTRTKFTLPKLAPRLSHIRQQLLHGLGFILVRGIDRSAYSVAQLATMFYGLGAHIGNARMQNAKGHVLGHVRDLSVNADEPDVRIYQTNERQTFHTDSADVVALLCLNKAKSGGESLIVSAVSVYNEMLSRSPDLLPCLFDPVSTDRRGEIPQGMKAYFSIPVFTWFQNNLSVIYQRQYIDSAQRFEGAFKLTDKHVEALNKFDELCNDPSINLQMQLEPGDIQFVYNHSLLHDRRAFVDFDNLNNRRHLLRLWLSVPGDRALPEIFSERFHSVSVGERGGMQLQGVLPCAPLEAG